MDTIQKIKKQISENLVILYMKGSPKYPSCGFSSKASKILIECNIRFAYVDVLANPDIRLKLPNFSGWPTFPQLWVKKKLIGGCDILINMYKKDKLKSLINIIEEN